MDTETDNLLNESQDNDLIYEIISKDELLKRILQSNLEMTQILNNFISSVNSNDFNSTEIYAKWFSRNLRNVIKSSNALLKKNDIDDFSKNYIQSILFIANLMVSDLKILISSAKIMELDYEFNNDVDYDKFIRNIKSLLTRCDSISEKLKLALNNFKFSKPLRSYISCKAFSTPLP